MFRRHQPFDRTVRSADGREVVLTADRSGVVRWEYGSAGTYGEGWGLVLVPVLALGNVLAHRFVFAGGWTVRARLDGTTVAKRRCRNHRAAQAALERLAMTIESTGLAAVPAVR